MNHPPKYFIPAYGGYYHFMVETAMGLYFVLRKHNQIQERDCEFWYNGNYASIVQMFSRHPVHILSNWAEIPENTLVLPQVRPKIHEHWAQLDLLREYFDCLITPVETTSGITVIKRIHKRSYAEHDELMKELAFFEMPVREAILEEMPFKDQVNLMRNTCILIAPHGAGVTNMIFMPRGSSILELYPRGFYCRAFRALAKVFGHLHVDLESETPSVIKQPAPPRVQMFLDTNGWPTRRDYFNWSPDRMEMGRVLRDVASFSISPKTVVTRVERMLQCDE